MLTNLNDAWGGFTSEMLIDLIDEFFNNTSSDKQNLLIYGIMNSTKLSERHSQSEQQNYRLLKH